MSKAGISYGQDGAIADGLIAYDGGMDRKEAEITARLQPDQHEGLP